MASPNKIPSQVPLPPGWVTQYDTNYKQWFYVNTNTDPPTSSWIHPNEIPQQPSYSPPVGAPPHLNNPAYHNTGYPSPPATGGYNPGPGPQYQGGSQAPYQQQPSQTEKGAGGMGGFLGLLGKHGSSALGGKHGASALGGALGGKHSSSTFGGALGGKHGSSTFGGLYPGQQHSHKPPKKHGGMGGGAGLALGAGAGLLGGLLVADAVDDAFDGDAFGGGDFGGGDFGGGDCGDF